jgi:nucleoid DNA-binding protein
VTRSELIAEVTAAGRNLRVADAEAVVQTIFGTIMAALSRGDRVEIRGFGVFATKVQHARVARDPRNGDQSAAKLRAANTAYSFVNEVAAFSHHPALRRATVATPNCPVSIAAPPVLSSDGARALGPVPAIGEHSAVIRTEFAG